MKLKISIALLLALTPSLALARPKTGSTRMRPQLFRDRAPKARLHDFHTHEVKMPPPKSPPPPVVKEDFQEI
jgi:hypothetical protein